MGEEDIWAKALEEWNNQDPTWKQQNFREDFSRIAHYGSADDRIFRKKCLDSGKLCELE